jgi:type II secretory pathway pseudopilin PulG
MTADWNNRNNRPLPAFLIIILDYWRKKYDCSNNHGYLFFFQEANVSEYTNEQDDGLGMDNQQQKPRTSKKAICSLILGILGICPLFIITGIPAIILGIISLRGIKRNPGGLKGNGMAITGIILGCISIPISIIAMLVAIAVPNFLQAHGRARVWTVQAEQRNMAFSIESYKTFNGRYPTQDQFYDATHKRPDGKAWVVPATPGNLTSPVGHIGELPGDPFSSPTRSQHYGYWTDPEGKFWILCSVGPDHVADADLEVLGKILSEGQAITSHMNWFYDLSNGTKSSGDIIKTGP